MQQYPYDVALSFAGEDRIYAEALADALVRHGIEVFYDKYEKNTLWGKDLYTYLSDLYQIRLDNTQIPGLLPTIGYLSWSEETPESIADAIVEKLGKPVQNLAETKSVEKKITHELSAEYEKQIQQVGGMIDFRQAINARDWKQAEKVLQKYPNLPEARSSLGLSMSQAVQEYFSYRLHPSNCLVGGPVAPLYRAPIVRTRPAPPKLEAIH